MASDRDEMLKQFIENKDLIKLSGLSKEDLSEVTFSSNESDLLIKSLKKMIFSYCAEDSSIATLRKVNLLIKTEAERS